MEFLFFDKLLTTRGLLVFCACSPRCNAVSIKKSKNKGRAGGVKVRKTRYLAQKARFSSITRYILHFSPSVFPALGRKK